MENIQIVKVPSYQGIKIKSSDLKKGGATYLEYKSIILDKESEYIKDYYINLVSFIYKNKNNDFVIFEKPTIQTRFCFGYGLNGISTSEEIKDASNMEHYANSNVNYFLNENLKNIYQTKGELLIALINLKNEEASHSEEEWNKIEEEKNAIITKYNVNLYSYNNDFYLPYWRTQKQTTSIYHSLKADIICFNSWQLKEEPWRFKGVEIEKTTIEDVNQYLGFLDVEIEKFKKRLQTYLKRFGLSKLDTWTYLVD